MSKNLEMRTKKVYRGYQFPTYKKHPVILLKGLYLAKLGFQIGDTIAIELSKEQIVITKLQKKSTEKEK